MVERLRVTQPRQAAPRPDQGLLDGVLGQFRVAKDEAGRGIQARAGRADELGEGVPVASPCSLHEFRSVHGRLSASGTTTVAVLASLRRWREPEWFPERLRRSGLAPLASRGCGRRRRAQARRRRHDRLSALARRAIAGPRHLGCGATLRSRSQPRASAWRERFSWRNYCASRCQSGGESTPTLILAAGAGGDVQQERFILGGADTVWRSTREPRHRFAVRREREFGSLVRRLGSDVADDAIVD